MKILKNIPFILWFCICLLRMGGIRRKIEEYRQSGDAEKEIIEISARLQAAAMLSQGKKYSEIVATTKLSSRTVARISDWLQNGTGGYRQILAGMHHAHLSPARAE